jgi:hypothetical protein
VGVEMMCVCVCVCVCVYVYVYVCVTRLCVWRGRVLYVGVSVCGVVVCVEVAEGVRKDLTHTVRKSVCERNAIWVIRSDNFTSDSYATFDFQVFSLATFPLSCLWVQVNTLVVSHQV